MEEELEKWQKFAPSFPPQTGTLSGPQFTPNLCFCLTFSSLHFGVQFMPETVCRGAIGAKKLHSPQVCPKLHTCLSFSECISGALLPEMHSKHEKRDLRWSENGMEYKMKHKMNYEITKLENKSFRKSVSTLLSCA